MVSLSVTPSGYLSMGTVVVTPMEYCNIHGVVNANNFNVMLIHLIGLVISLTVYPVNLIFGLRKKVL